MKSVFKKKSVLIALLVVLLVGTGVAATLAYLSSRTPVLKNTFKVGNVTTKIEEEFKPVDYDLYDKNPKVRNIGKNDCYVRVRVVCSPENALELVDKDMVNWEEKDGYYYYKSILKAPGEGVSDDVTTPIFKQVQVKEDKIDEIDGFEVTVYQEAVQTIVYRGNGDAEPITDMYDIWDWYDNGGKESSSNNS